MNGNFKVDMTHMAPKSLYSTLKRGAKADRSGRTMLSIFRMEEPVRTLRARRRRPLRRHKPPFTDPARNQPRDLFRHMEIELRTSTSAAGTPRIGRCAESLRVRRGRGAGDYLEGGIRAGRRRRLPAAPGKRAPTLKWRRHPNSKTFSREAEASVRQSERVRQRHRRR